MKQSTKRNLLITAIVLLTLTMALSIFLIYDGVSAVYVLISELPDILESFWGFDLALTLTVVSSIVTGAAAILLILCIVKLIKVCKNK